MNTRQQKLEAFGRLLDIMDELREKCPWDNAQTNESLRANTIEETYELAEAIINNSDLEIKKELGDLLLHVVFYAKIGEEKQAFDIADVCHAIWETYTLTRPVLSRNRGNKSNLRKRVETALCWKVSPLPCHRS